MRLLLVSACAALFAIGCGPIDQSAGIGIGGTGGADAGVGGASPPGASPPAIGVHIVSPADGDKCEVDDHGNCGVSVAVSGGRLAAPGNCGGAQGCGHIDLFIDGTACGSPNVQSSSDNLTANFARCEKVEGKHTLMCELRDDRSALLAQSQVVRVEVKKRNHHGGGDGDDDHGGDDGDEGGHGGHD